MSIKREQPSYPWGQRRRIFLMNSTITYIQLSCYKGSEVKFILGVHYLVKCHRRRCSSLVTWRVTAVYSLRADGSDSNVYSIESLHNMAAGNLVNKQEKVRGWMLVLSLVVTGIVLSGSSSADINTVNLATELLSRPAHRHGLCSGSRRKQEAKAFDELHTQCSPNETITEIKGLPSTDRHDHIWSFRWSPLPVLPTEKLPLAMWLANITCESAMCSWWWLEDEKGKKNIKVTITDKNCRIIKILFVSLVFLFLSTIIN